MRKRVLLVPDGMADEPLAELGGRTPLEAARIPNMDWVARDGRLGRARHHPRGLHARHRRRHAHGAGLRPARRTTPGAARSRPRATGVAVRPDQMIFRCNFVTIADGVMKDNTAGHIAQTEADALIAALAAGSAARPASSTPA